MRETGRSVLDSGDVQAGAPVEIGVITGVGQAEVSQDLPFVQVETPYGPTSDVIRLAEIRGRRIALLARRGPADALQPHLVPYRANIWALASLGVTALITSTASGGLQETYSPGTFVVTDQVVDRTYGRATTFFDEGPAVQLPGAELFDPTLRSLAVDALVRQGVRVVDFGTTVVINGPRFSTAAESRWHAALGADLVNMTLMPEVVLARELGLAVVNVSVVTDRDAGVSADHSDAATLEIVRRRAARAQSVFRAAMLDLVPTIPAPYRRAAPIPQDRIDEVLARSARVQQTDDVTSPTSR